MAYNFPVADFSALGDIPKALEEGKQRGAQQNLADLSSQFDLNSVAGLRAAGQKAFGQGLFAEGNSLLTAAQNKENETGRRLTQAAYLGYLGKFGPGGTNPSPVPGAAPAAPTVDLYGETMGAPVAPGRPAPPPAQAIPGMPAAPGLNVTPDQLPPSAAPPMAPRAEIPPSLNAPPVAAAEPTPSEAVLAGAEGPPSAPPVQLAGPPPTPDTPAATAPVPYLPPAQPQLQTVPGAVSPTRLQVGVPGAASQADQARVEAQQAGQALSKMPYGSQNSPVAQAYKRQFDAAISRLNLQPAEVSYQQELLRTKMENTRRAEQGQDLVPEPTRSDFEIMQKNAPERLKSLEEATKTYNAAGEAGRSLSDNLKIMTDIVHNPEFLTGKPTSGLFTSEFATSLAGMNDTVRKGIANLADSLGIPRPEGLTTPAALRETFVSLGNRAVIQALGGSLGRNITDPERLYMAQTVPSLLTSKEGSEKLIEILNRASERAQISADIANHYYVKNPIRGSAPELHLDVAAAMDRYTKAHGSLFEKPNGDPTLLKRQVDRIVETTSPAESAAVAPPGGTPGPVITGGESPALGNAAIAPRIPPSPIVTGGESAAGGAAIAPPSRGVLGGLANLISGRAQVPPVTSQSEEDAKRMAELMKMITVQSEERAKHRFRPIVGL